jgi:hypothetical protein
MCVVWSTRSHAKEQVTHTHTLYIVYRELIIIKLLSFRYFYIILYDII